MATIKAWPVSNAIQYDGTNSAEIVSALPDLPAEEDTFPPVIDSEEDGVLTISYPGYTEGSVTREPLVINETDWVLWVGISFASVTTDSWINNAYRKSTD